MLSLEDRMNTCLHLEVLADVSACVQFAEHECHACAEDSHVRMWLSCGRDEAFVWVSLMCGQWGSDESASCVMCESASQTLPSMSCQTPLRSVSELLLDVVDLLLNMSAYVGTTI